ncbi:hypothetical protein HWV62_18034 [Athelia sp. TMB]|nr:hypothetical protein HWV62_18034 [Athelia sp. TMB]
MSFAVVHAASLFLTFVFTLVGGALGVSAIVKCVWAASYEKLLIANLISAAEPKINGRNWVQVCLQVHSFSSMRVDMSARTLLFQALTLLTFGLALFGALVPYTLFLAKREAEVTAFLGLSQIPTVVVTGLEDAVGWTGVYRDVPYCKHLKLSVAGKVLT